LEVETNEKHSSGAEAKPIFVSLSARLKSCSLKTQPAICLAVAANAAIEIHAFPPSRQKKLQERGTEPFGWEIYD